VQPVDVVVGEDLHELVAVFCSGICPLDMQRVEAAAVGDGQAGKFQECGTISRCRVTQEEYLEILKFGALDHELAQWPLLERVLVSEILNCELFEALLLIDSLREIVKHRVDYLRRRAGEFIAPFTANVGFSNRLKVEFIEPVVVDA